MTKEYVIPFPSIPEFRIPKLYRVDCEKDLYSVEIQKWLNDNCRDRRYCGRNTVEFEDEKDAVLFALRWL